MLGQGSRQRRDRIDNIIISEELELEWEVRKPL